MPHFSTKTQGQFLLMGFMNKYSEIMTETFEKRFINDSDISFAAQAVSKFSFHPMDRQRA